MRYSSNQTLSQEMVLPSNCAVGIGQYFQVQEKDKPSDYLEARMKGTISLGADGVRKDYKKSSCVR